MSLGPIIPCTACGQRTNASTPASFAGLDFHLRLVMDRERARLERLLELDGT
jgi:rRNA maturation protein Nop10